MNPETKMLRERTARYLSEHPRYAHKATPPPPKRKRRRTKHLLKGDERCAYCGKILTTYTATLDHVIPLSRGGTDTKNNIVWCCKRCNQSKGNMLLSEWKQEKKQ